MDNGLTPQLLVDATVAGVEVPSRYVRDGQIVLNVHDQAVDLRQLGNEELSFAARFGGRPCEVRVPVEAVLAIFARENGQGIFFRQDDPRRPPEGPGDEGSGPGDGSPGNGKPRLRVVK